LVRIKYLCDSKEYEDLLASYSFNFNNFDLLQNIHNLRRRYYCTITGAKNNLQGSLAVIIFFIRLFSGNNAEGDRSGKPEKPLSEIFANKAVK
jgi:hypothetical protein